MAVDISEYERGRDIARLYIKVMTEKSACGAARVTLRTPGDEDPRKLVDFIGQPQPGGPELLYGLGQVPDELQVGPLHA
jgi:hypothetical protein